MFFRSIFEYTVKNAGLPGGFPRISFYSILYAMKPSGRVFLILAGISLVFGATLMLIARPPSRLPVTLPPVPMSSNIPYFVYLRGVQLILGYRTGAVIVANALIVIGISLGVFRMGWVLA